MDKKGLFEKVRKLNLPNGKYVLFGSLPMGIRGLKECNDADILVSEDIFEKFKNQGWNQGISQAGFEYLHKDEIELYKNWAPGEWNVEELISRADVIDGLLFASLEDVIKWKHIYGREKDLKDIEIIKIFLVEGKK